MNDSLFRPLALALILISFALVIGCAQTSPTAPSSSAPAYSTPAPVTPKLPVDTGTAPPVVPANPNTSPPATTSPGCAISLDKSSIVAGQGVNVQLNAQPGPGVTATYLCGDSTATLGTNGLFNEWHICTFNTPGHYDVWLAFNGQMCASAPLDVMSPTAAAAPTTGSCWIVNGSRSSDITADSRTYTAQVQYANYTPNSTLTWDCKWNTYHMQLGSPTFPTGNGLASGVLTVNCQYTTNPGQLTTLPVHVNNDFCGDLLQ